MAPSSVLTIILLDRLDGEMRFGVWFGPGIWGLYQKQAVHPFLASNGPPPSCTMHSTSTIGLSMVPCQAAGVKERPWMAGVASLACA